MRKLVLILTMLVAVFVSVSAFTGRNEGEISRAEVASVQSE